MSARYPIYFHNQPPPQRSAPAQPVLSIPSPTDPVSAAIPPDFRLEFTWTPSEAEVLTISFRGSDADHCFKIEASQEDGLMALYEVNGGVHTSRSQAEQIWQPGAPYRISISAEGTAIQSQVDGVVRNSYSPAAFNQTATGLYITGFTSLSNLMVWPV